MIQFGETVGIIRVRRRPVLVKNPVYSPRLNLPRTPPPLIR